jgi:hypothetical protein
VAGATRGLALAQSHLGEAETNEAAQLGDIRFALRGLDPWSPKGNAKPSEDYARKVLKHLKLCGWEVHRPLPKAMHRTR